LGLAWAGAGRRKKPVKRDNAWAAADSKGMGSS
jgi:hypothetical protein